VEAQAQMKYHHLERCFTYRMKRPMVLRSLRAARRLGLGLQVATPPSREALLALASALSLQFTLPREDPTLETLCTNRFALRRDSRVLFRDICQMGSLAGAAYLLHNNAGVLRRAQWEQKSHVEHKRQGLLD